VLQSLYSPFESETVVTDRRQAQSDAVGTVAAAEEERVTALKPVDA